MGGFLDGTVVLDLSSVGPAARASRILADYGAEVIKVGPPPRKQGVQIDPPFYSYGAGRGMKRARIDLKAAAGKRALLKLAERADVLIESFRPGVADRLGIGYRDVRALNPRIIYCSTSGYGQSGPRSGQAGHDIDYLAVGGFLHCSSRRADGTPAIPGATVADSAAGGMHAAIAILAALAGRARTGEGAYLDVAVADGVLHMMSLHVDEHLATGSRPGPGSSILTGRYACYDVYRTRDGKFLAVGAIEPAFFANLCRRLGLEEWIERQLDDASQAELRAALAEAFARRDRDEWLREFEGTDACVAPVLDIEEVVRDPQFVHRGAFVEAEHPERGRFKQVGPVLAGCQRPEGVHKVPTGTDTAELLAAAGLTADEIEQMRAEGVIA
ncbi:MAG: CoA transferase [Candidatus Dadabacteria bacterium]|nr:MAG: CoA transferase [Candidatus Dadabacteria bacterium]